MFPDLDNIRDPYYKNYAYLETNLNNFFGQFVLQMNGTNGNENCGPWCNFNTLLVILQFGQSIFGCTQFGHLH